MTSHLRATNRVQLLYRSLEARRQEGAEEVYDNTVRLFFAVQALHFSEVLFVGAGHPNDGR